MINFRELIMYRELIYFLTWRDLKVRYKQTILGVAWAVIQPVMTMVVFSVFFGGLAKVPSDGIPYPLFSLAGLMPWQLFENSMRNASKSLVANRNMITKIYFPRVILPLSSILASLVDFFVALPILIVMMIVYGYHVNIYILLIPYYLLLTMLTSFGVSLWFSALGYFCCLFMVVDVDVVKMTCVGGNGTKISGIFTNTVSFSYTRAVFMFGINRGNGSHGSQEPFP